MMHWQRYLVTVTLGSDLHCGDRPLGFVARSHPFVPGHIPWYAAVAALVRLNELRCETASYQGIEKKLFRTLRFSPFYILDREELLYPWRRKAAERIQAAWLGSQYGVSLYYDTRGAKKNHLFEMETILAVSRDGIPTRLRGACFIGSDVKAAADSLTIESQEVQSIIVHSVWGGQQNKGCGILKDVQIQPGNNLPPEFGELNEIQSEYPLIGLPPAHRSAYPLRYTPAAAKQFKGALKPLVGRRFASDRGPGLLAEPGTVVWEHGWQPTGEAGCTVCFSDKRYVEEWNGGV